MKKTGGKENRKEQLNLGHQLTFIYCINYSSNRWTEKSIIGKSTIQPQPIFGLPFSRTGATPVFVYSLKNAASRNCCPSCYHKEQYCVNSPCLLFESSLTAIIVN
ncbi:hypothetical protein PIROE2DRAFT_3596 [Piromyces sp. E2]|nr:hypothetical protein PIROE2DRAFT_3596 [Piromyces sp. E2]|eukprot:OUM68615.1 hypothetical protein PIROE2DRAFT_3596 [Piromyces sp. E2]